LERKVEQLLLHGLSLLVELREPFMKEWKMTKYRNSKLLEEFNSMILFAFQELSKKDNPSVDTFIFTLLTEWQNRFPLEQIEEDSIFLITVIESIFHRILSENPASTFLDHQAIQTFFARILDHSFITQNLTEDRTEKWIKMIVSTNVIPIKWLAVVKKDQEDFKIDKVVSSENNSSDAHLLEMCKGLKAGQMEHLSIAISRLLGINMEELPIIQITCINDTLLICPEDGMTSVSPQQIDVVRTMYLRQLRLHQLESNMEWKDASLLFLQRLIHSRNPDEAVQAISKGFVDYMPFKRCALFLYNQYEEIGIGVSGYNVNAPSVQQIKEEIFKLSFIKKYLYALIHSQPLFFETASAVLPEKYVREFKLKSLVVVPIFVPSENKILGIALLDQGEDVHFTVSTQTLTTLVKFGHYAGELLNSIWDDAFGQFANPSGVLTTREKEVLKLIAEGSSINEAAEALHLSSYTVRDYVSGIIQKLEAKNRTDAAVKAIRMKVI
jgi:DNA-binding CsgD family transcriptional regulator